MATQRASFDDIAASCGNLKNLATAVDKTGDSTQDAVGKIKDPTWDGDAARAYATDLKKLVDNLPEANRQLALSVLFLASCADGYEKLGADNELMNLFFKDSKAFNVSILSLAISFVFLLLFSLISNSIFVFNCEPSNLYLIISSYLNFTTPFLVMKIREISL